MFGNSDKANASKSISLIGKSAQLEGKISFSGSLEIEGKVLGDITAEDNSKSEVIVREHGVVEGQIESPSVVVNGKVVGDIYASDQLFIAAKAVIEGSVHYRLIEMEKGAQISGNMLHRSSPQKDSASNSNDSESLDSKANPAVV